MDLQLKGLRALVTGSSSGLGAAIAHRLAREGAHVVVHGRDAERVERVADGVRGLGGHASTAIGDLGTGAGAAAVVEAVRAGGQVDILVNNAGAYAHREWWGIDPDEWVSTFQVNVVSGVRMVQAFVPDMIERAWGRVITIGGGLGQQPIGLLPDYSASLAARHNAAKSLSRALGGTGVTSNVVAPGSILIDASRERLSAIGPERGWGTDWDDIEAGYVASTVPNDVGRMGRPEEIADATTFLASPLAGYITGAILRVDGGVVRSVL